MSQTTCPHIGASMCGCPSDLGTMSRQREYTVITQHGEDRKVKRTRFSTFEEAKAFTQANTPDTDAHMAPNVDQKYVDHKNYEAGGFWFGNRHAAIHKEVQR